MARWHDQDTEAARPAVHDAIEERKYSNGPDPVFAPVYHVRSGTVHIRLLRRPLRIKRSVGDPNVALINRKTVGTGPEGRWIASWTRLPLGLVDLLVR